MTFKSKVIQLLKDMPKSKITNDSSESEIIRELDTYLIWAKAGLANFSEAVKDWNKRHKKETEVSK